MKPESFQSSGAAGAAEKELSVQEDLPDEAKERGHESFFGDHEAFLKEIRERAKEATPEQVEQTLRGLEYLASHPDRMVEVYTDPELETFCCGQIPAKTTDDDGDVIADPRKRQYLIGVPFLHIAGQAPEVFLRGEIAHELGHALYTDFIRRESFANIAESEGYDPKEILDLDNCIEDPRMERVVGGHNHPVDKRALLEKNKLLIIPSIASGITKMTPTEQFRFLLKLEGLWSINGDAFKDAERPWKKADIHPKVRQVVADIKTVLDRITGTAEKPPMKISGDYQKAFLEEIWPVYKQLIDEFPDEERKKEGGKKRGASSQKSQEGKQGDDKQEGGEGTDFDPEAGNFDPKNQDGWPPELQKFFKKMVEKHERRLTQKAEQAKHRKAERNAKEESHEQAKHELLKKRDGFEDPEAREAYNRLSAEVRAVKLSIERIFKKFFPKAKEHEEEWKRTGKRFDVKRMVRHYGTGLERPMGQREHPQEIGFLLQILVDVSGSMYSKKERIQNAVKACIALSEAAEDTNVSVEILASDDSNVKENEQYCIKSFEDRFTGKTKARVVGMLQKFGGDNKDADAILAALERLHKKKAQKRSEYDRIGSLMIFITDSETDEAEKTGAIKKARAETPLEGLAVTKEAGVAGTVRKYYGQDSIIPKSIDELPEAIREIVGRHVRGFGIR